VKKQAAAQLAARYNQLVGIDTRLQRLDKAVAENERRIYELTRQAQKYTARSEPQKLSAAIRSAEKLQKHNSHLFKIIERTEDKLSRIAQDVADTTRKVNKK
jgi:uncharacterized protein YkuJ